MSGAACGHLGTSCKLLGSLEQQSLRGSRPQDPSPPLTPGREHAPYGQVCLLSSCPSLPPVWGCLILRDGRVSEDGLGSVVHTLPLLPHLHRNIILTSGMLTQKQSWGFPGGAVVESLPANAGDTGSSPGLGGSHMPRSNWAREPQLLILRVWSLCSATREAAMVRGPRTTMKSGPLSPQLEKALVQKRRPNTAKTKLIN